MGRETREEETEEDSRRHDRWRENNNASQTARLARRRGRERKNYRSVEVGGPRKREGGGATRCQENRPGENKLNLAE